MSGPFVLLEDYLHRRADNGRRVDFWLRDDDAVEPTDALEHLLGLGAASKIPLALAVIPAFTGEALARRLADAESVTVLLHGWAHNNHAPDGEKKQEFGPHRPYNVMLAELTRGRAWLRAVFGERFYPLFVPPWNRIDPFLIPRLPEAELCALSTFGTERRSAIAMVNTHVDIIDWHGTRGGRDPAILVHEIIARLDHGDVVGVLTHHLVHDRAAWDFLAELFALTSRHPACRWRSIRDLADERTKSLQIDD